jgi:hypothetical protein
MYIVRRRNSLRIYQNEKRLRKQLEEDERRYLRNPAGPFNDHTDIVIKVTEFKEISINEFLRNNNEH